MPLTAFERNLVAALRTARPFVEQARNDSGGLSGTGELVFIDSVLTAAGRKDAPTPPTIKPGPRCKRTPDMFGGAEK
ncbi:hypothetical protein EJC49_14950 [Aquibium carbonis]|uniref:Uncharacterized protein n=1 Tax=Aquibium carbonis TaxID=2495581 RepID=A0A429YVW5_9HYPH|nr:hypothetical protein [Aquibium carbonis]RST85598.1 hypothetical protein EJC49_14950 [Aquibium carbonis]